MARGGDEVKRGRCRRDASISPKQVNAYVEAEGILIDLREKNAYDMRHIQGAISVPMESPMDEKQIEWLIRVIYRERARRRSGAEVLLYCHRGATSLLLANELRKRGICVFTMAGGIEAYRGRLFENV